VTRHERRLKELSLIARDVPPIGSARIACSIYYRNELVAIGTNKLKSHPLQDRFKKNSKAIYLHAEIEAIKNAIKFFRDLDKLKYCTIYISRQKIIKGQWVDGLAKPCSGCQRAILAFGFREVIYTENG
jgi:tRNA(Arg) A34 adenosine deaminase TadA